MPGGGGGLFFIESPRGGGKRDGAEEPRANWGIFLGGGGAKYFFRAETSTK